jgi:hypothetical protein
MAIPTLRPTMLDHVEAAFQRASQAPGALELDGRLLSSELPQHPLPLTELRPRLLDRATSFKAGGRVLAHAAAAARLDPDPWALGPTWLLLPGLR